MNGFVCATRNDAEVRPIQTLEPFAVTYPTTRRSKLRVAMNTHTLRIALAVSALLVIPAQLFALSNCPGPITTNFTATEDLQVTSNTSCISVNANNLNVNLGGFQLICNNAGGCVSGVDVPNGKTGTTVHDGFIVAGTGQWTTGVSNGSASGAVVTTTVDNLGIYDVTYGVVNPYIVQHSVFTGISSACTTQVFTPPSSNGHISQNYCNSSSTGFEVVGTATAGPEPIIERNYIRATTTSIDTNDTTGFSLVQHNIIDDGALALGTNSSASENICHDLMACPEPSSNFSLTLDFQ